MKGSYTLKRQIGGYLHFAKVEVRVEAAACDEVYVSDEAFAWRLEEYGPQAWGLPDDERMRAEALEGAEYALHRVQGRRSPHQVTVTTVLWTLIDTGVGDVRFAAVLATYLTFGVDLHIEPRLGAVGLLLPD